MLIILEGPDGAGKTTLATSLRKLIEEQDPGCLTFQWHRGPPTEHPLDEYLRPLNRYRPGQGRHVVIDRWHWGESIYPKLRDRPSKLDFASNWAIEAYLQRLGALVVLVDQSAEEYRKTYIERGEVHLMDDLPQTQLLFTQVATRSQLPFVTYDRRTTTLQWILDIARGIEGNYAPLNQLITYCGPRWPMMLLLGDVRHNVEPGDADPAFVPMPATSGSHLLKSLHWLSGTERRTIGWANACDVDSVHDMWIELGKPRVAALGRKSHSRLTAQSVQHGSVPHPQFARRFHHGKRVEYGQAVYHAASLGEDLSKWPESLRDTPVKTPTPTSLPPFAASVDGEAHATAAS